jgi:hypothetical protein
MHEHPLIIPERLWLVILSEAKDLVARQEQFFTDFTLSQTKASA